MSEKTKSKLGGDFITAYSELAIRNNGAVVEYCRTAMAALSGCTAGILGLTGLYGFAFYILAVVGLWILLLLRAGSKWNRYFLNRKSLLTNGFIGGLCTYVLFWTFFYTMVHVY